jgi:hypothetical protein
VHDEGSLAVHLDTLGAVDVETDPVRIGAASDDVVVLEPARAGVVHEVDAGVDVDVSHVAVRRRADGRFEQAVGKVADDPRKRPASHDPCRGVRADRLHADDCAPGTAVTKRQNGLGRREERGVGRAARHELHLCVDLATVGLEGERPCERRRRPDRHGRDRAVVGGRHAG